MTMLITTKMRERETGGRGQGNSPKGEEVNLLVSAQIKMLLNANEATQWGESERKRERYTHYSRYLPPLPFLSTEVPS